MFCFRISAPFFRRWRNPDSGYRRDRRLVNVVSYPRNRVGRCIYLGVYLLFTVTYRVAYLLSGKYKHRSDRLDERTVAGGGERTLEIQLRSLLRSPLNTWTESTQGLSHDGIMYPRAIGSAGVLNARSAGN